MREYCMRSPASAILTILFLAVPLFLSAQEPVAWYPFNGDATDASGNGHDGRVHGAYLTMDRFGNCNSAYAFNGDNEAYIEVPESRELSFAREDFTVVSWVKFCLDQPEYAGIVSKGPPNTSYPGYQLQIGDGANMTTQVGDENDWSDERRGNELLNDGRWHMLAMVVSPQNNRVTLYVDGNPVEDFRQYYEARGPLNVSRYAPTSLLIGTERNRNRFFTGIIDDVRLYNRVLRPAEVGRLYHEKGWGKTEMGVEPEITILVDTCGSRTLRLSVGCYPSIKWSTGETTPVITPCRSGRYSAVVSDGDGCERNVSVKLQIEECELLRGIKEEEAVAGMDDLNADEEHLEFIGSDISASIYPNPVQKKVWLDLEVASPSTLRVEILDMRGRILETTRETELSSGSHKIALPSEDLSSGTYILRITAGGNVLTRQIVVQH